MSDLVALKNHLLKNTLLNGAYEKAGDLSKKGKITISDLIAVKKQILGM